ncbi:MAG TPA: prolyl oligopeptidase family serine peptidase [Steroidobacter sp.]|uniref:prolyl oligopeptidase family serine peptidase n=1 Tax=Steroidobacter sp. TaxID=1978227 RepID=UPI002ED7A8A6
MIMLKELMRTVSPGELSRVLRAAVFAAVTGCIASPVATAAQKTPRHAHETLEIADVDGAGKLQGVTAVSSDGQWIAYTVCNPARIKPAGGAGGPATQFARGCDIQVRALAGGAVQSPTEGVGNNWGASWAPDGRQLAFYSDRDGAARLWLWTRGDDKPRRLSAQVASTRRHHQLPAWTPDGRYLIAQFNPADSEKRAPGPRQMPIAPAAAGAARVRFLNGATFSPQSQSREAGVTVDVFHTAPRTAVPAANSEANRAAAADALPDILPAAGRLAIPQVELRVVELSTGQLREIAPPTQIARWWLSPDGKQLAALEVVGLRRQDRMIVVDLVVFDVATGARRVLARTAQYEPLDFTWSPDGRWIAYLDCGVGKVAVLKCAGDAWIVEVGGSGGARRLSGAPEYSFNNLDSQPRWAASSAAVYWASGSQLWQADPVSGVLTSMLRDTALQVSGVIATSSGYEAGSPDKGRSVYVTTTDPQTLRQGIGAVNLATGALLMVHEDQAVFERGVVVPGGKEIVIARSSAADPRNLWVVSSRKGPRQVTQTAPRLERVRLGESRLISFVSRDGAPLKAALLLPADYQPGKRYPLMVSLYASFNQSELVNDFSIGGGANFSYQMLANRGWAVLKPDMPVQLGTPLQNVADTVLPAVDAAIALGIADPDRLALNGQSNGGFATLALLVQTDRFKAAIVESGYADMATTYLSGLDMFLLSEQGGAMGSPPWENPQRYLKNSPIYKLDRVTTPLLMYAGVEDRAFAAQMDATYFGLAGLGKDVTYLRYEGEGHALRTATNKSDYWQRVWAFLERTVPTGARSSK